MTTIKIFDGRMYIEVEVDDEFAFEYREMEHKEALIERKETRRHQSFEAMEEGTRKGEDGKYNGYQFIDPTIDIEREAEKADEETRLHKAIEKLTPQQQWLIEQIYFKERSQVEIAKELGVGESAIRSRLKKIHERLKKLLN